MWTLSTVQLEVDIAKNFSDELESAISCVAVNLKEAIISSCLEKGRD